MKLFNFFLFVTISVFSQKELVENVDCFVGVDIYENYYYLQNGSLFKSGLDKDYKNIELGTPSNIDISNPLQILLFYKYFNKIILLDNQLNLISSHNVPINTELVANAGYEKIWIYNNNQNTLGIYNLSSTKTEITSIPIFTTFSNLKGNLNSAIVLTHKQDLFTFNYVANKINHLQVKNTLLPISLNNYYTIENNQLTSKNQTILKGLTHIESFEFVNNSLYFLKENKIYKISILKK